MTWRTTGRMRLSATRGCTRPSWRPPCSDSIGWAARRRRSARWPRHEATAHWLPRVVALCADHGPCDGGDASALGRRRSGRRHPSYARSARSLGRAGRARSLRPEKDEPPSLEHRRSAARPGSRHRESLSGDRGTPRQDRHEQDPANGRSAHPRHVRRGYVQHPGVRRRPGRVAAARLVPADGGGARRPGTAAVDGRSPSMIAHRVSETSALRERLARSLDERREPGAAELCDALERLLDGADVSPDTIGLERLQKGVYRLRVGGGSDRTLVLKRHTPAIAHTDRLVAERWLPALGLGERCPRLLAAAAQREGRWVWHVYEDLRSETLADRCERPRLDRKSTRLNSSHTVISYAVFCLKKKLFNGIRLYARHYLVSPAPV